MDAALRRRIAPSEAARCLRNAFARCKRGHHEFAGRPLETGGVQEWDKARLQMGGG
eukprot:CAMPEP_0119376050 /NCGR_PEP_ID=MMETSP1334-20130426/38444_1 /TAXON_ID=127549 /ORGANISM="Calcidiscus leptoporus, Strain RCC1130" /LENGTH=55 /DNA_ID=CAMNT_0007394517 /DNA_START=192 /DNA_END=355 /DNA_ORIENTATION=+